MDVTKPIPNQEISAAWGAAVADGLRAAQVGGPGFVRAPSGTSAAPAPLPGPRPATPRRLPFDCWVRWAGGDDQPLLAVQPGRWFEAGGDGTVSELEYGGSSSGFATQADGAWAADLPESAKFVMAVADGGNWSLAFADDPGDPGDADAAWPVALWEPGENGPWSGRITQLWRGAIVATAKAAVAVDSDNAGETGTGLSLDRNANGELELKDFGDTAFYSNFSASTVATCRMVVRLQAEGGKPVVRYPWMPCADTDREAVGSGHSRSLARDNVRNAFSIYGFGNSLNSLRVYADDSFDFICRYDNNGTREIRYFSAGELAALIVAQITESSAVENYIRGIAREEAEEVAGQ